MVADEVETTSKAVDLHDDSLEWTEGRIKG